MGSTLSTWEARVTSLLGAPSVATLPVADIDAHVFAAIRRFSSDVPRVIYADYVGDSTTYDLAKPASWVDGFSFVRAVEYPRGQRPALFLDPAEVVVYPDITTPTSIRLNETTPETGQTARVYFAVPYPLPDVNAATDLVPATSFEPVAKLAASFGAAQLAGRAASNTRGNLPSANLVGIEGEEKRWLDLANDLEAEYDEHVGSVGGTAASGSFDWDARSTFLDTGRIYLTRPRRR